MEEIIDYASVRNSAPERAIHFLLRHNECRMALMSDTSERHQPVRVRPLSDPGSELQRVSVATRPVPPMVAASLPARALGSGESCAARFSRAYAAARHSPAPINW